MIESDERKWICWFSIIVCATLSIPYLLGYFIQGSDVVFTGFLFGVLDGNSYIAKMLLGATGAWLFKTPYTITPQNGALIYFPYLLLGKLTAPPGQHEQLLAIFQGFRIATTILLTFATYDFIALFIRSRSLRRFGTILIILGGGLGWLSFISLGRFWMVKTPLEFYSPEAFGFLMVLGIPHLACARAWMLLGLRNYLDDDQPAFNLKFFLKNIFIWMGVGLMQPIAIVVSWIAIGLHLCIRGLWNLWLTWKDKTADWRAYHNSLLRGLCVGFISSPFVIYTLISFRLDPFLRAWGNQNILTSPEITEYLLAYALLLPFAVLGVRAVLTNNSWQGQFITGWVMAFPLLIYLPVSIQRRLVEGVWIGIVVLALAWFESRGKLVQKWAPRLLLFSLISSALFLSSITLVLFHRVAPIFRTVDEVKIFHYLAEKVKPGDVVLASNEVSNAIPAWAPVRTIAGHGPESVNGLEMIEKEKLFYQPTTPDAERVNFLSQYHINYVFWGPQEREYGGWDPSQSDYLIQVYSSSNYKLFQVNHPFLGRQ